MARLIKTNGLVVDIDPVNGTDFSLQELQACVEGYIEIVRFEENGKPISRKDFLRTGCEAVQMRGV